MLSIIILCFSKKWKCSFKIKVNCIKVFIIILLLQTDDRQSFVNKERGMLCYVWAYECTYSHTVLYTREHLLFVTAVHTALNGKRLYAVSTGFSSTLPRRDQLARRQVCGRESTHCACTLHVLQGDYYRAILCYWFLFSQFPRTFTNEFHMTSFFV